MAQEEFSSTGPGRSAWRDFALRVNSTAGVFHAVADQLLVNIEADVIHTFHEEPPWLSLNQLGR
jgi:hypothetical protein